MTGLTPEQAAKTLTQPKNGVAGESRREDNADLAEVRGFVPR